MSTRCQIEFKTKYGSRTVYRHSDGYPESNCGVIQSLKDFIEWNDGRNDNLEYMTANYIYYEKRMNEERMSERSSIYRQMGGTMGDWKSGELHDNMQIGYGICENGLDGRHGDIEYFYTLQMPEGILTIESVYSGKTETVKLTE